MKTCNCCKATKPYTEFPKKASTKDGYYGFCKVCKAKKDKEYNQKNKVKIAQKSAEYRKKNKESLAAARKIRYHSATPEEKKERARKKHEYNKTAPAHVKQRKKEYDKKYFSSEAGKITTAKSVHKRRAQKIATEDGTVTSQALEELKSKQQYRCYHCNTILDFSVKGQVHLDHLMPLSKGGCHSINNVVWSCASCNLKKSNKLL